MKHKQNKDIYGTFYCEKCGANFPTINGQRRHLCLPLPEDESSQIERVVNKNFAEICKQQRIICANAYQPKINNLPKHSEAYKTLSAIKERILNAPTPDINNFYGDKNGE